jgi:hypothetical protein
MIAMTVNSSMSVNAARLGVGDVGAVYIIVGVKMCDSHFAESEPESNEIVTNYILGAVVLAQFSVLQFGC